VKQTGTKSVQLIGYMQRQLLLQQQWLALFTSLAPSTFRLHFNIHNQFTFLMLPPKT